MKYDHWEEDTSFTTLNGDVNKIMLGETVITPGPIIRNFTFLQDGVSVFNTGMSIRTKMSYEKACNYLRNKTWVSVSHGFFIK